MPREKECRRLDPIILTDRVIASGSSSSIEWGILDKLHVRSLPVGYGRCAHAVYVVSNQEKHLKALELVGEALSFYKILQTSSTDLLSQDRETIFRHSVLEQLMQTYLRGDIGEPLYKKLRNELLGNGTHAEGFSTRWEVASLLYAPTCIEGLPVQGRQAFCSNSAPG